MTPDSNLLDVPDHVYAALRSTAPAERWVRLVTVVRRGRAEGEMIVSTVDQVVLLADDDTLSVRQPEQMGAAEWVDFTDYFEEEVDEPDWSRIVVTCDCDGLDRAAVEERAIGEQDFADVESDPAWDYLELNRPELEQLARRAYG